VGSGPLGRKARRGFQRKGEKGRKSSFYFGKRPGPEAGDGRIGERAKGGLKEFRKRSNLRYWGMGNQGAVLKRGRAAHPEEE